MAEREQEPDVTPESQNAAAHAAIVVCSVARLLPVALVEFAPLRGRRFLLGVLQPVDFMTGRGKYSVISLITAALLAVPVTTRAASGHGPHETVKLTTSARPGASSGFGYAAWYHGASGPHADPPALRRLVIQLPRGSKIDTTVPGRCTASDSEIMLAGESACPRSARVGSGEATVRQFGSVTATYPTVLYNAPSQQLELVESGSRVLTVVHTYVHGTTLNGPVPTCVNGGNPPKGCPFDQFTLLRNHLQSRAITVRHGVHRRNYGTTPPTCPKSRRWTAKVRFYYGDGSVDHVTLHVRCRRRRSH